MGYKAILAKSTSRSLSLGVNEPITLGWLEKGLSNIYNSVAKM